MRAGSNTEDVWGFIPYPLPPDLALDMPLINKLSAASLALGTLKGLGQILPNPHLFVRPFLRREAVASSRIEGTVADLKQLLLFEESEDTAPRGSDVGEVNNYVQALEYGLAQPKERSISAALIKEMHSLLMTDVRGGDRNPGRFRNKQVYIGQHGTGLDRTRFVPPPPPEIAGLMDDLERFIAQPSPLPELVRLALIHYQFETIHPFEDGNGRLGRLLIPLLLCSWSILDQPLIYVSDYFEQHRTDYLDSLLSVSQCCDWNGWIDFFLDALKTQADDAVKTVKRLLVLREEYRSRYQEHGSTRLLRILDDLFDRPTLTVKGVAARLGIGYSSAQNLVTTLEMDGTLVEVTGRKRNRVYVANDVLVILTYPEELDSLERESQSPSAPNEGV